VNPIFIPHREKYKITLDSIKIPLCLCVCSGERSLKLAEIISGSSDSPTENSEEPKLFYSQSLPIIAG
jgi:hypothetical protein